MMKKYDTDGDGALSEEERAAMREDLGNRPRNPGGEGRRNAMMKQYDTDGDGTLSEEERAAMREDRQKKGPPPAANE
jgi:Ca2+-binding EF-hand superfamily protein